MALAQAQTQGQDGQPTSPTTTSRTPCRSSGTTTGPWIDVAYGGYAERLRPHPVQRRERPARPDGGLPGVLP